MLFRSIKNTTKPGTYELRLRITNQTDLDAQIEILPDPEVIMICNFSGGRTFIAIEPRFQDETIEMILSFKNSSIQPRHVTISKKTSLALNTTAGIIELLWNNKTIAACDLKHRVARYKFASMVKILSDIETKLKPLKLYSAGWNVGLWPNFQKLR